MDIYTLRAFHGELRKMAAVSKEMLDLARQTGRLSTRGGGNWSLMGGRGGTMSRELADRISDRLSGDALAKYTHKAHGRAGELLQHAVPVHPGLMPPTPAAVGVGSGILPVRTVVQGRRAV